MKKKLLAALMSFVMAFGVMSTASVFADGATWDNADGEWVISGDTFKLADPIGSIPGELPPGVEVEPFMIVSDIAAAQINFAASADADGFGVVLFKDYDDMKVFDAVDGKVAVNILGTTLAVNGEVVATDFDNTAYVIGLIADFDFAGTITVASSATALSTDALVDLLGKIEALIASGSYTDVAVEMLQKAYDDGSAFYNAIDANTNQNEVDAIVAMLNAAYTGVQVESVAINEVALISIKAGATKALNFSVVPAGAAISWKSSNSAVVTVTNGKILAKKAGTAVITAYSPYVTAATSSVTVRVTP